MGSPQDKGASAEPGQKLALLLTALAAAVVLGWWTGTDRLDLPKQWLWVAGSLAVLLWAMARHRFPRADTLSFALALAGLLAVAAAPREMAARVEGWAGWMAAVGLVCVARHVNVDRLTRGLALCSAGVVLFSWLQGLGVPLLNSGLFGLSGRRVVGTLGGPGHLGWTLAVLAPWTGTAILRWAEGLGKKNQGESRLGSRRSRWAVAVFCLGLFFGSLLLSGSRVAVVMTLCALPFWFPWHEKERKARVAAAFVAVVAGGLVAFGADALTGKARLDHQVADLGKSRGSARGRVYLWRVHLSALPRWAGFGRGPEGFVRRWPAAQNAFLREHPGLEHFASDLRHAHADPVEVLVDFGIPGLGLGVFLLFLAYRRKQRHVHGRANGEGEGDGDDRGGGEPGFRGPASATLIAVITGGLGAPVLFFAPTLCLAALAYGIRLGPPTPRAVGHSVRSMWATFFVAAGLLAALVPLTIRLASEVQRSRATRSRMEKKMKQAGRYARSATGIDGRNPRAWIERAIWCEAEGRGSCALSAWQKAARDLPIDAVTARVNALGRVNAPGRLNARGRKKPSGRPGGGGPGGGG